MTDDAPSPERIDGSAVDDADLSAGWCPRNDEHDPHRWEDAGEAYRCPGIRVVSPVEGSEG